MNHEPGALWWELDSSRTVLHSGYGNSQQETDSELTRSRPASSRWNPDDLSSEYSFQPAMSFAPRQTPRQSNRSKTASITQENP